MHLARLLHLGWAVGLWVAMAPCFAVAQSSPPSNPWMQKHREHEIGKIVRQLDDTVGGQLDGNEGSVEYLLFVILPVIGLIGLLSLLRRRYLN